MSIKLILQFLVIIGALQKARILLMLGLMKTTDPKKIQQYFMDY